MTRTVNLDELNAALQDLHETVQREFPDDAGGIARVLARSRLARSMPEPGDSDVRELASSVSALLSDRPGSLGEAIIPRDDYDERYRLNEDFDSLRLRIRRLAAELDRTLPQ